VLLFVSWLAASYRHSPTEGPLPLQGTLDLMVWSPTQSQRQGLQLGDQRAVPLRTGDRVRLSVELNRPAYAYVVWLDVAGIPAPVYPWQRGDWANLPPTLPAAAALALPADTVEGWQIRVPRDGMETLLLLVRRTPLPAETDLRAVLANLPQTSIPARPNALWFHGGHLLPAESRATPDPARELTRDPVLDQTVAFHDPLLKLQQTLVERLTPHFELIRAVSFPVRGD
jgi:hypothetical protein